MAAPRPNKGKKSFQDNNQQNVGNRGSRGPAWRTNGNQNFANAARQGTNFPPLAGSQSRQDTGYDPKMLSTIATQIGQTVIVTLKNGARHEGIVVGTSSESDSPASVTLKDCKDLGNPSNSTKESFVLPASNLASWVPAAPRMANGSGPDNFRTDTDISGANGSTTGRERELRQWQPDAPSPDSQANAALRGDEATFGPTGQYSGIPWDQFEVNEQLFGVTTKFDEDAYTTKLDRSAPDFKERERKAQQIADEIQGSTTSNPHVAEERVMNGMDNGLGEEEKFSAVVRSAGAYVPPGARKNGGPPGTQPSGNNQGPSTSPTSGSSSLIPTTTVTAPENSSSDDAAKAPPADPLVANFRDFVTSEKQRLAQRKQAMVKNEMDKRKADLLKFSKSFKLNKPIPEDLVPILAKTEEKQKAIVEKVNADILASSTQSSSKQGTSKDGAQKTTPKSSGSVDGSAKKAKTPMFIQAIPPFDKSKQRPKAAPTDGATPDQSIGAPSLSQSAQSSAAATPPTGIPGSPTPSMNNNNFRLNANASTFRPNPNASAFKPSSPVATPSPKAKEVPKDTASPVSTVPNPFFGTRVPSKKNAPVHLKEDFNPFRHAKVAEASQISSIWPYNGKRFTALYPLIQSPHVVPVPNMPAPNLPGPPPPPYEEDPANQGQAQRQQQQQQQQQPYPPMMYYAPQYPYGPPPHGQPPMMMQASPPGFMPPYMPLQYPQHMPPNHATPMYGHPPPGMQGVPPPHAYLPPPPHGSYPQPSPQPPNGAPRGPGGMTPQPMPHPYYHPSPQLSHAMPYPTMMMAPQAGPHFDPNAQQGPPPTGPPQTAALGNVGH